uniref:ATPase PAAT isoform X2 n=1 Tax=Pogona vitticeps TaxID=103695 RepID=A0A6J0UUN3_9SAUR
MVSGDITYSLEATFRPPRYSRGRWWPSLGPGQGRLRTSLLAMASSARLMAAHREGQTRAAGDALPDSARISAACSWECRTDLASVLRLVPEGELGAWEAVGPPQNGEDSVVLEGRLNNDSIAPCLLYLHCDAHGSEEIIGLGVVSEARNMEVYIGEEYCRTAKGEKIFTTEHDSKNNPIMLYKKYLKLDCSTASCKIKLLSIGEKQRVLISKILVQVKTVTMKSVSDFAALGSGIDIRKVQTIVESVGSKLSPGAQQLMDMVRFQQKNGHAYGEKLQNIFGRNGYMLGSNHTVDGSKEVTDLGGLGHLHNGPSLLKATLMAEKVAEDMNINRNRQVPSTGNISECPGLHAPKPSDIVSQNDFRGLVSSFLQEQGNENPDIPNGTRLLPLLQTVCGQVNRLRLDERNKHCENNSVSEDCIHTVGLEQQPVYMYLEKLISKNMELMEKRLMDYIDVRMQKLQEHVDNKIAAVKDLVQDCNNVLPENGDLREGHLTGKR